MSQPTIKSQSIILFKSLQTNVQFSNTTKSLESRLKHKPNNHSYTHQTFPLSIISPSNSLKLTPDHKHHDQLPIFTRLSLPEPLTLYYKIRTWNNPAWKPSEGNIEWQTRENRFFAQARKSRTLPHYPPLSWWRGAQASHETQRIASDLRFRSRGRVHDPLARSETPLAAVSLYTWPRGGLIIGSGPRQRQLARHSPDN